MTSLAVCLYYVPALEEPALAGLRQGLLAGPDTL